MLNSLARLMCWMACSVAVIDEARVTLKPDVLNEFTMYQVLQQVHDFLVINNLKPDSIRTHKNGEQVLVMAEIKESDIKTIIEMRKVVHALKDLDIVLQIEYGGGILV